jgi:hypothetical protein
MTRLLELTQLKTIALWGNDHLFQDDKDDTQHFVTTLQHKNCSVQQLPGLVFRDRPEAVQDLPATIRAAASESINNSLARNQQLNRVNLLLLARRGLNNNNNSSRLIRRLP